MSTPNGYLNRKIAESVEDAIANYSTDHIKTLVKSAIQDYIESFMNTKGKNRQIYEILTKLGLQYVTDQSFDQTSDPSLRKTQIARLFEQIRQQLPCILVMDSSFEYVPMNMNGMDKAWTQGNEWYGQFHIARKLSITVVAGTRDQSSTDFLHGLLSILFGELKWFSGGTSIRGNAQNGEKWVMTMGNPVLGKVSQSKVSDDPKDTIWFFDIEVPDILFEDVVTLKQPLDKLQFGEGIMNPDGGYLSKVAPVIEFPTTILMNQPTQLFVNLMQDTQRVMINDPNVAVYNQQTGMITARKPGTFKIQIIKPRESNGGNDLFNQQDGRTLDVLAEKTVKVLFN